MAQISPVDDKASKQDLRSLPFGWQQHWSQEMGKWYYVQMTTVPPTISFVHPLDMAPALRPNPQSPPPAGLANPPAYSTDKGFPPHLERAPSINSVNSGMPSSGSPSAPSPRGSVAMSIERVSTSSGGTVGVSQAHATRHSHSSIRSTTMPLNPMPYPQPHPQSHPQSHHGEAKPLPLPSGTTAAFEANQLAKMPEPGHQHAKMPEPGRQHARMPEPEPRHAMSLPPSTNFDGIYKVPQPIPGGPPQSNSSILSFPSSSTMGDTNSVAPLKPKKAGEKKEKVKGKEKEKQEKKEKKKDSNKKSIFGTSGTRERAAPMRPTRTRGTAAHTMYGPNQPVMGLGGQAQMGQMQGVQQNVMGLGLTAGVTSMQNTVGMVGQMGLQTASMMTPQLPTNQRLPPGVIDLRGVAKTTKKFLGGALYLATGISPQDLANFRSRMTVAFSGVPLNEIGIDAKQLEAVFAAQPRANYQGVINALMIQQQKQQILALQTGQPVGRQVDYQSLILQVRKMQGIANTKMQQSMAMNAGARGVGLGQMGGIQGTGMMGQPGLGQQHPVLQQRIMMEQQKLQQMQVAMGQTPMSMNQGQMLPTGFAANPMMQGNLMGVQPLGGNGRRRKGQQIANTTMVGGHMHNQVPKKKSKQKPLPPAPGGKKKKKSGQDPSVVLWQANAANNRQVARRAGVATGAQVGAVGLRSTQVTGTRVGRSGRGRAARGGRALHGGRSGPAGQGQGGEGQGQGGEGGEEEESEYGALYLVTGEEEEDGGAQDDEEDDDDEEGEDDSEGSEDEESEDEESEDEESEDEESEEEDEEDDNDEEDEEYQFQDGVNIELYSVVDPCMQGWEDQGQQQGYDDSELVFVDPVDDGQGQEGGSSLFDFAASLGDMNLDISFEE